MNSKYQPGGARFACGGASTLMVPPPTPLITHSMPRCDMLYPCVTAPARSSTTSSMSAAFGVLMVKSSP